jgi:hypothetical protein
MHRVFRATKIKIGTSIGIDLGTTRSAVRENNSRKLEKKAAATTGGLR